MKSKKKCYMCEEMHKSVFPFETIDGIIYLDTEGCIGKGLIEVFYCPLCGEKIVYEKQT